MHLESERERERESYITRERNTTKLPSIGGLSGSFATGLLCVTLSTINTLVTSTNLMAFVLLLLSVTLKGYYTCYIIYIIRSDAFLYYAFSENVERCRFCTFKLASVWLIHIIP